MKITVVGLGYVGISIALLLAQKNQVVALDIDKNKINLINSKKSPIKDIEIEEFLINQDLNFYATFDKEEAYQNSEFVVIAIPTNYDNNSKAFNTSSIESVIRDVLNYNSKAVMVIKSTVPIGFTESIRDKFNCNNIIFSPEFLREGRALADNLFPSRIILGDSSDQAIEFAELLKNGATKKNIDVLYTNSSEAEAIKLFSNAYLAMRVAYFNEVDTFSEIKGLDPRKIIDGISHDPRIGLHYNNPSFGYGGYCLPKDTRQLITNFENIPNNLVSSIEKSNSTRKDFIVQSIVKKNPKIVGVYRIIMKSGSDNFRESSITDIIKSLCIEGISVVIFEPLLERETFVDSKIINDLDKFKKISDLIITNRSDNKLLDVAEKLYTRDLFNKD